MTPRWTECRWRLMLPLLASLHAASVVAATDSGPLADEENAPIVSDERLTLSAAVEAALALAPGQATLQMRQAAADVYGRRSRSLLSGAPSAQLRYLSDRADTRQGVTETEAGIDLPLWRWNQRAAVSNEAAVNREGATMDQRLHRWDVAGAVRESYWSVREAQQQLAQAQRSVEAFIQLEKDVLRRVAAGDAADSERLVAEGQRREREAAQHEAEVMLADRFFGWRLLTGLDTLPLAAAETVATETRDYLPLDAALTAAARAHSSLAVAQAEGAGAPRLLVGMRTDTQDGTQDIRSLSAQLSVPFGGSAHRQAQLAPAQLEAARADDEVTRMRREAQLAHHEAEHELHAREIALNDANARLMLADREATLARRAYTLGESSLSERLLTEIRAAEAQRTQALAVIAHARAIARFNQINGVAP